MRSIFSVAALITCSQALAQQDTLAPVTLTANKYSTKTTETGKVVTIISRQDLERAGSRDLAQAITEFGGAFINGYTSNAGKEKNIYLRGARVDHTLITIDGVPVYDASGIGSNFDIRNLSIEQVERIEILKGSQGTLYGSDAIAGVINIITRKGNPGSPSTRPNVTGGAYYGSYQTWRAHAGIDGAAKNFNYSLGYARQKSEGFSEAEKPYNVAGKFEKDDYEQENVNASFGIQAAKTWNIQPFFRVGSFRGALDQGAFVDEVDYDSKTRNLQTGVRNVLSLGKVQLNVLYQFNRTNRSYLDDSTGSRNGYYRFATSKYRANEHFGEAFIVYPFGMVKLTAGADVRASNTDYTTTTSEDPSPWNPTGAVPKSFTRSGDSVNQQQVGVYAALHYVQDAFSAEAGGRYNNHSEYGSNFAFNINPSYRLHRNLKVFANVSSGYKTPSLYQLFSEYGNTALKPESSINIEGGLQLATENGKSSIRATYFHRRVKDVIIFFYNPTTFRSQYINQDQQKDHGMDVDARTTLGEKIQLRLNYGYVTGKVTTQQAGKDTSYFNLLRRPGHTLNFLIGSQVTKSLYVNAGLNAIGERQDVFYDASFQRQDITLKSYVLVNFYAEYGFAANRLKLFADLRNLFNEQYADIYGYNTAGFNAYGGLRFRL